MKNYSKITPEGTKDYLFDEWKFKGTCLTIEEYFTRANAGVTDMNSTRYELE